jgi:predicted ferric reductase
MRITMLHLVLSAAYLAANIAFLMVGVNNNQARARRAAIAASTNLVLVAAGGRTNVLADSVGVPYQPYYFAHHWLGRLAIAEATVHGVLNRDGKRTKQWVFGLVVSAAVRTGHAGPNLIQALIFLGFIGLSSVSPVRKKFQLAFVKTHLFLALASLAVLPHLWLLPLRRSLEGKIPLSCSAAVWAVVSILRWRRRIKTRARPEGISDYDRALVAAVETNGKAKAEALRQTGATFVKVELPKNVRTYPGAYFYVFFSKLPFWRRYRAIPLMAFSWEPLLPDKLQRYPQHAPEGPADPHVIQDKRQKADHPPNGDGGYASKLTFLILNKPSLSQLLTEDSPIVLDGPYGPNLKLDRFDTVVLAAKGIGIAGALPFLLYLAYRKHHDHARKRPMKERLREEMVRQSETEEGVRYEKTYKQFAPLKLDRTRRITLLWVLESSSQINWASQQFRALAGFDTRRVRF